MSKEHSPIPIRISDLDAKNKIVYCCPKCGEVFSFYRDEEQFCHKCGNQIDWHDVPTYLTDEQKKKKEKFI